MAKAKQRFSWLRNATARLATKIDSLTKQEIMIDGNELPEVIQEEIFVYGLSKIVDDRLSQVPADLKIAQAALLFEQLKAGNWKAERTGGIHLLPLVIEAIVAAKGCSPAKAQEAYRLLDEEQRIVLKSNLAESMAEIAEARKAAEDVELDDLLS